MPRGVPKRPRKSSGEPEVLRLSDLELARMEKSSQQIRACDAEALITLAQKNSYIQQIDPQGNLKKFDSKLAAIQQERQGAEADYRETSRGVEERLGIKLSGYAYDDRTGVLNELEQAPPAPGKAVSKT